MGDILHDVIGLAGSLNPWLILTILGVTSVGEFGFAPPYVMETIWLITGYHVMGGTLSPEAIISLCAISLIGREIGAGALYKVSGYGRTPLLQLYQKIAVLPPGDTQPEKFFKQYILAPIVKLIARFYASHSSPQTTEKGSQVNRKRPYCPSTLNVVLGRFSWLKIPITINLGLVREPQRLVLGVGLFSLAWDGLYILLGAFGEGARISPVLMLGATLGGLILVNVVVYGVKRLLASRRMVPEPVNPEN